MMGWLPSGHRDPLGQGELASVVTQGTVDWRESLRPWELLGRLPRSCISQLAPTALSLFGLLNLCFGSLFHTPSDSLLSPLKALGHLPGREIKCEVKHYSDPHYTPIVSALPHLLYPQKCRMLKQPETFLENFYLGNPPHGTVLDP